MYPSRLGELRQIVPDVIARYVGLFSYDETKTARKADPELLNVIARYVGLFSYDELVTLSSEFEANGET